MAACTDGTAYACVCCAGSGVLTLFLLLHYAGINVVRGQLLLELQLCACVFVLSSALLLARALCGWCASPAHEPDVPTGARATWPRAHAVMEMLDVPASADALRALAVAAAHRKATLQDMRGPACAACLGALVGLELERDDFRVVCGIDDAAARARVVAHLCSVIVVTAWERPPITAQERAALDHLARAHGFAGRSDAFRINAA